MKVAIILALVLAFAYCEDVNRRMFAWKKTAKAGIDLAVKCANASKTIKKSKKYQAYVKTAASYMKKAVKAMPLGRRTSIWSWAKKAWTYAKKAVCSYGAGWAKKSGCPWMVNTALKTASKYVKNKTVRKVLSRCLRSQAMRSCKKAVQNICNRRLIHEHLRRLMDWKKMANSTINTVSKCARADPSLKKSKKALGQINTAAKYMKLAVSKSPFRRLFFSWIAKHVSAAAKKVGEVATSAYHGAKKLVTTGLTWAKNLACSTGAAIAKSKGCPMAISVGSKAASSKIKSKSVKAAINGCLQSVGIKACRSAVTNICGRRRLSVVN